MKKFFSILSIISILSIPVASAASFSDVRTGSELSVMVDYLNTKGIIKGYADGTFKPERTINRAEALKIIFEAIGAGEESDTNSGFPDVPQSEWFAKYVTSAKKRSMVKGYSDGKYKPNQEVNRVEFIKMAISALPFNKTINASNSLATGQFSDIQSDQWYVPFVAKGLKMNFLSNTIKLKPNDPMQRQDAATIIYNIAKYVEDNPSSTADSNIPYIPDEAFTTIDPTDDRYRDIDLGPDKINVTFTQNSTKINHRAHGYDLNIDENVKVSAIERTKDITSLQFADECVIKLVFDEGMNAQQISEKDADPMSFMIPYSNKNLKKLTNISGIDAYEFTINWDNGDKWTTHYVETNAGTINLNVQSYNEPSCLEKSLTQLLPNISKR
ncbi:MAG: S-layer homology domain-containing protein [Candidatus Gracilibacteria bacterium]|nr:S-layer homology domain-containing protein [Candidatus Gracilibacteria bacterium]